MSTSFLFSTEHVAQTVADRQKLVQCKDGVKGEIRLLEQQMDLAQMVSWMRLFRALSTTDKSLLVAQSCLKCQ